MAGLAEALSCPARVVNDAGELDAALAEIIPSLVSRREPLLLQVNVEADLVFNP